jgi:hypothetical protein
MMAMETYGIAIDMMALHTREISGMLVLLIIPDISLLRVAVSEVCPINTLISIQ